MAYDGSGVPPKGPQTLPFLKWAGGKRWLFRNHRHLFPDRIYRLVDPFLGGGAAIFFLQPEQALLSDVNSDLIRTYRAVRANPLGVARILKQYQNQHSDAFYYETRSKRPSETDLQLAAWFLYLNRTCWNGLYRVNLKGMFNVPRGTKDRVYESDTELVSAAQILKPARLHVCDFEDTLRKAGEGDVIFADPPYFESPQSIRFVKYNHQVFSWNDQIRLKSALIDAAGRGAKCYLTNANDEALTTLYAGVGRIFELKRHMIVAGQSRARRFDHEMLVEIG